MRYIHKYHARVRVRDTVACSRYGEVVFAIGLETCAGLGVMNAYDRLWALYLLRDQLNFYRTSETQTSPWCIKHGWIKFVWRQAHIIDKRKYMLLLVVLRKISFNCKECLTIP